MYLNGYVILRRRYGPLLLSFQSESSDSNKQLNSFTKERNNGYLQNVRRDT